MTVDETLAKCDEMGQEYATEEELILVAEVRRLREMLATTRECWDCPHAGKAGGGVR